MIKVALLHFSFEDYTIQLANGLAHHAEVTLIHPTHLSTAHQKSLNPRIRTISFWKPRIRDPRNLSTLCQIMKIIQDVNPDVLHVQETNIFWYDFAILLNRLPPLVTTIHDIHRHPGDRDLVLGAEYTRRISYYRSQHLIVHTQSMKSALAKQFQVPRHHISVLPHGELGSLYQSFSNQPKVKREPFTLLFFGRIWPYKGLKYLLEAMPLVAQQIPEVKLIIAGRGEALEQYFPNGYDSNRYEILNRFIPSETIASLFQRSASVVLPYIESSQSGVTPLAYAMGTPVIASNVGGLAEMIHHEEDGLLVPPADVSALASAIVRLLRDTTLQLRLQQAALARCQEDLNWSNIAAQTVEIYQKVCFKAGLSSERM